MPIQLNCPHCAKRMVVRDDAAGTSITCPKCKKSVDVPRDAEAIKAEDLMAQPQRAKEKKPDALVEQAMRRTCQYCQAELPLTGSICLKCFRDIETGKKLPLLKRFAQKSAAYRLSVVIGGLLVLFVGFTAVAVITGERDVGRPSGLGPRGSRAGPAGDTVGAEDVVKQLILARNLAERGQIQRTLAARGAEAVKAIEKLVHGQIKAQTEKGPKSPTEGDIQACVLLLAEIRDPASDELLNKLIQDASDPQLQVLAALAMAQKGNEAGLQKMIPAYFEKVRRLTLERYWDARKLQDDLDPLRAVIDERQDQLAGFRRAIIALEDKGLAAMIERYWDAWNWLGTNRGEAWLREVDAIEELAANPEFAGGAAGSSPPSVPDSEEEGDPVYGVTNQVALEARQELLEKVEVLEDTEGRKAFDWLKTVVIKGKPNQQMAAALYIARRANPDQQAREKYAEVIGNLLAHPDKVIQQRATWTFCKLINRVISWYDATRAPFEADDAIIAAARAEYKKLFKKAPVWQEPTTGQQTEAGEAEGSPETKPAETGETGTSPKAGP